MFSGHNNDIHELILKICVALACLMGPAYASGALSCQQVFSQKQSIVVTSGAYLKRVKESWGLELILRSENQELSRSTSHLGFVTHKPQVNAGNYMLQALKRGLDWLPRRIGYQITGQESAVWTPFRGLYELTVRKPTLAISGAVSRMRREPGFFLRVPVGAVLGIYMASTAQMAYKDYLVTARLAAQQAQVVKYENMLSSDFRFQGVRLELDRGSITKSQALRQVRAIAKAQAQYFKFASEHKNLTDPQVQSSLLDHYLFGHLSGLVKNGVQQAPGYRIPDHAVGPLKKDQINELFKATHILNYKQQLVAEIINKTEVGQQVLKISQSKKIVQEILENPFFKKLQFLFESGEISRSQFLRAAQENISWQYRFHIWEVLGIERLVETHGGQSHVPISIHQIRLNILQVLQQ